MTSKTYYRMPGYKKWHTTEGICTYLMYGNAKCGKLIDLDRDGLEETNETPPESDICRRCEPERKP